jgi:plastocyanin
MTSGALPGRASQHSDGGRAIVALAKRAFDEEHHWMNGSRRKRYGFSTGAVIALLAFLVSGFGMAAPAAAHGDPHPAHIHVGDCSAPGEVVGPLENLAYPGEEGTLASSQSSVELTLDDILAEPHSIVVHESEENIGNYVLCGDIGGVMAEDGTLAVALGELNGSGMAGLAILSESDAGTDVMAFSIEDASVEGMADDAGGDAHPAHVHNGTCEAPADVIFPLANIAAPEGDAMGADVDGVEQSTTKIKVSLPNLLDGEHSIVAHLSEEEIGTYLVCGDVTGEPADGMLAVQLNELAGSGYIGLAILTETDGGINVQAFLMPGVSGGAGGEESTPDMAGMDHGDDEADDEADSGDQAAAGETVEAVIEGFAFSPGTIEITAGTTVTWTNNDSAPHTVTGEGGAFQSGRMDQGATFSFTFDAPGTYNYYCEFHPNMTATVIVT